jgi:hypothetical protein
MTAMTKKNAKAPLPAEHKVPYAKLLKFWKAFGKPDGPSKSDLEAVRLLFRAPLDVQSAILNILREGATTLGWRRTPPQSRRRKSRGGKPRSVGNAQG